MSFALELHVHSRFSFDCVTEPARIVEKARAAGLSGVAIVDHDSMEGSILAAPLADESFLVIPGMEIPTRHGDLIALFIEAEVKCRDMLEAAHAVRAQGGIAILAHPYLQAKSYPEELFQNIDAIEVINPRANCWRRVRQSAHKIVPLIEKFRLGSVGGSDAHTYWEIGNVRNLVPSLDTEDIKRAIRQGEVKVTGRQHATSSWWGLCVSQVIRFAPKKVKNRLWPK